MFEHNDNRSMLDDNQFSHIEFLVNRQYANFSIEWDVYDVKQNRDFDLSNVDLFKIKEINNDSNPDISLHIHNLYNVLSSLQADKYNIIYIIKGEKEKTSIYFGLADNFKGSYDFNPIKEEMLQNTLKANYPGLIIQNNRKLTVNEIKSEIAESLKASKNVSCLPGIPSLKKSDSTEVFSQGVDRIIDAMQGKEYVLVAIAEPVSTNKVYDLIRMMQEFVSEIHEHLKINVTEGTSTSNFTSKTHSVFVNLGLSIGLENIGLSAGGGYGFSQTKGESTTKLRQESKEVLNKRVEYIETFCNNYIERLQKGLNYGFWKAGVYLATNENKDLAVGLNSMRSIYSGENSHFEPLRPVSLKNNALVVLKNLKNTQLSFPNQDETIYTDYDKNPFGDLLNASTTLMNTEELSIIMNMPRKEVMGLPVYSKAAFARNINYVVDDYSKYISIGNLWHLGNKEDIRISLNIDKLTMHTFVTGSTGAGKTNTILKMLLALQEEKKSIPFLIIEPTKGEYAKKIGGLKGVNVFGTNYTHHPLLRLNPLSFPAGIHVLEHIDRLTDILNACWPMYAAMPAILKQALEQTYIKMGWDLEYSTNESTSNKFPNLFDLLVSLREVISISDYSADTKSDYAGALITRVQSLTNGLNGRILCGDDIDPEVLFSQNSIIDISRVGSIETKSLLMGLVFMKLNEHLVSQERFSSSLKHITVLEEAHHLLRRTSSEFSDESSNIRGKAVEMITNAIAEMRAYGEGFIIADQSPELLDKAVIRNTNTKIILRLPEEMDKQLVGKSASLNEEQIEYLSKLDVGIACIFQNGWTQAILCDIDEVPSSAFAEFKHKALFTKEKDDQIKKDLLKFIVHLTTPPKFRKEELKLDYDEIKSWLEQYSLSNHQKKTLFSLITQYEDKQIIEQLTLSNAAQLVHKLYNPNTLFPARIPVMNIGDPEYDADEKEKFISKSKKNVRNFIMLPTDFQEDWLFEILIYNYALKHEKLGQIIKHNPHTPKL